nr:RHS repeat-associated core domain-containing protein [Streptomyces cupreus]
MEQADITLPGVLPLVFTRRVSSGYHSGWWFGPSWASTIDQRLEMDERGIVFVTEDGMLLTYPHPEGPGDTVLPDSGPRWPLVRLDQGGYRVTDPSNGRSREFASPTHGLALLDRISDRNHNTITFEYDSEGTPVAIRHSGGYCLTLTVEEHRVTALNLAGVAQDGSGSDQTVMRYGYDDGNLVQIVNYTDKPLQFTYDSRLRITSWEDTNHSRYHYVYDQQDRCVEQGGEAGHLTNTFTYDGIDPAWADCRITEVTTAGGASSRFAINEACLVVAEIDPLGNTTCHTFDSYNQLLARTDALGHTTRYTWDVSGNVIIVQHADGARTVMAYNSLGQPVEVVEPGGAIWRYTYDDRGNHLTTLSPELALTQFSYDDFGRRTSITDPLGNIAKVECDGAGLPIRVTDPLGGTIRYERDDFGRPVKAVDPVGATTYLGWTAEGKISRRVSPDGSAESWTYDGQGNCTSYTDAVGGVTTFEYTHFDVLAARTEPDGARYTFDYDAELRLSGVTNPLGMRWTYEYDRSGHLIAETDFDDRTHAYAHDATGWLTARTTPDGQTIRYERDVLGRVVSKDTAGTVTTYAYDEAGDLVEARGADAVLTLDRDREGRVILETVNGRSTAYTYDALGRRTGRATPSGAVSSWSYDAAGNRAALATSGRLLSFTYDGAGRELSRHLGENLLLEQGFDSMGRLSRQEIVGLDDARIQSRTYTYRADGYLVGTVDQLGRTRHFDLDAVGRVTSVRAAGWTETYAYDAAGNQTQASWPAGMPGQEAVGPRSYVGTRIRSAGGIRYEHDDAGRITQRQKSRLSRKPDTWRYTWDAEDRLTAVVTPDGTRWRYRYDPLGRRIAKQRLAESSEIVVEQVDFVWDGSSLCEQTAFHAGMAEAITLTWDHDGLRPLAQTERKTTVDADTAQQEIDRRFYAIVTDLVGTPTELVDEQGNIGWRTRTTLWGCTVWNRGADAYTPLRYPGQYHDPETGLHYNYFRHYDPETARYLTPDPLGLTPAPNPVTYVHNPYLGRPARSGSLQ